MHRRPLLQRRLHVSYISIVLWVETIRIARVRRGAGHRAELMQPFRAPVLLLRPRWGGEVL